ncbi:MAG TPA: hypothetical protein V6D26_28260 [Stenomitos sp.]
MNARLFTQTLISATVGTMTILALTGSPLWAQKPEANNPPASSTSEDITHQHQQMMGEMQQMMDKCKAKMSQGMMGSRNTHTGGEQGQHGQGSMKHNTTAK